MTRSTQRLAAPVRAFAGLGRSLLPRVTTLCAAALVAAGLLTAGPAFAQSGGEAQADPAQPQATVKEKFQDWQIICQKNGDRELCAAVQEVMTEGNRLALWAAFGYLQPGQGPVLLLRVPYDLVQPPTGFRVTQGAQIAVDGAGNMSVPMDLCGPGGCQVALALEDNLVAALKSGNRLNTTVSLATGQTATINASLKGFTAAFDSLTKSRPK